MAEQDNSNLTIEATSFARADTTAEKKKLILKPIPIALGMVFLALFLSAMFMFTANKYMDTTAIAATTLLLFKCFNFSMVEFNDLVSNVRVPYSIVRRL